MNTNTTASAAVAWLERDYDQPDRFAQPDPIIFTPVGLFQFRTDHHCVDLCEADADASPQSRTSGRTA